jgi:GNAT superfamily N-acetyltransferase
MQISHKNINVQGIRVSVKEGNKEIGRAFLYILKNNLKKKPFGYLEDLFVDERFRRQGIGTKIIKEVINLARENNCYKIVATARYANENVHRLYKRLGFKDFGKEFKMYLHNTNNVN